MSGARSTKSNGNQSFCGESLVMEMTRKVLELRIATNASTGANANNEYNEWN